jgi:hypothetical protein
MEIRGNKPAEGSEARRFSAGRSASKPGEKSFGAALKQAVSDSGPASAPAEAPRETASPAQASAESLADRNSVPTAASGPAGSASAAPEAARSEPETSFADHMEMVRFRLKTGYYASKAIDDALTDKLSGYFDELA